MAEGRCPAAASVEALRRAELEALAGAELASSAKGAAWSWASDEDHPPALAGGARRWCSMEDCGTAEKMRRYVARRAASRR